ncbi:MAG TPA: MFS transporter [Candidatus Dormibacteraeota bacterium]|jgi:MFS family permease|nr:MFS transporter [Candidatus Dormibacteraeota bacterium]
MQTAEEIITTEAQPPVRPRPWTVLSSGAFRKLWSATILSLLGDFFSYVAMAWLVLQLTGSSLALGTVLVIQALPRAVLMVVGGALADRVSPRLTMLGSMSLRALSVAPLAALILTGHVQMWQVYAIAAIFGVVDAFFMPARMSILPSVVKDHELEPGNALLNLTSQASVVVGPILGGLVVASLGVGWAFAADAAFFTIGFLFILWLPVAARDRSSDSSAGKRLGGQIVAGLRYAWADIGIRSTLVVVAVIDFAANGAYGVGLPTLAHNRYGAGAAGLGIMLGAWGLGAAAGALAAGFIPPPTQFGWLLSLLCVWFGLGTLAVGVLPSVIPAAIVMAISGVGTGVVNTYGLSWLQRRTLPTMQGRVMSVLMLASMGLTPVAYAVSGAVAEINVTALFVVAGAMSVLCGVATAASRQVRELR